MEGTHSDDERLSWPGRGNQESDHKRTRRWRKECRAANVHPDATHERNNVRETSRESAVGEVGSRDRIPKMPI